MIGFGKVPVYNKLVRDKIPEIIEQDGSIPVTKVLNGVQFKAALREKLLEEVHEYLAAETREECREERADIAEVLHWLDKLDDFAPEGIEDLRVRKAEARGGFAERIFLIETHTNNPEGEPQ